MVKMQFPSQPFFHKIANYKVFLFAVGSAFIAGKVIIPGGLLFLTTALILTLIEWYWYRRGWKLTRSLKLKEYLLVPTNLKVSGLPPGRVFENHLQASLLQMIMYLLKIKKPVDFKLRTEEMKQSYFNDYSKIAENCKSGRWGERVYIVGTTHPNMMKWWVDAFEASGFKALYLGTCIDPDAKLSRIGWWMAQIAATGQARSKKTPEKWETCIAVWEQKGDVNLGGNMVL